MPLHSFISFPTMMVLVHQSLKCGGRAERFLLCRRWDPPASLVSGSLRSAVLLSSHGVPVIATSSRFKTGQRRLTYVAFVMLPLPIALAAM